MPKVERIGLYDPLFRAEVMGGGTPGTPKLAPIKEGQSVIKCNPVPSLSSLANESKPNTGKGNQDRQP